MYYDTMYLEYRVPKFRRILSVLLSTDFCISRNVKIKTLKKKVRADVSLVTCLNHLSESYFVFCV